MAAGVVAAEHYDAVHARCAHFAEGDFLRAIRQNVPSFARCIAGDAGFLTLIQGALVNHTIDDSYNYPLNNIERTGEDR